MKKGQQNFIQLLKNWFMSKAWDHKIRKLTDAEILSQTQSGKNWYQWKLEHPQEGIIPSEEKCIHQERKCRISHKCENESEYMLTYRYVTGRAGRTSWAEKPICEQHAQKYMENSVELKTN